MDSKEFRKRGKEMIDIVADYLDGIESRKVIPDVEPGYLKELIPESAPEEPEKWDDLVKDIERVIMPGVTHWHSPHFHAYFPTANSYPAICADILSDAIACIGFTWIASPACTELEVVMMDWLGKILKLPDFYLASSGGLGGGVIQGTASEATFVALLAARNKKILEIKTADPTLDEHTIRSKLICYASEQAHTCAERGSLLGAVRFRKLPVDGKYSLRGSTLQEAIEKDRKEGLIPFFISTTLGTTSICSFDNINELGPICQKENLWMHIDAAYAGSAFICAEYRYLLDGVEYSDSFNFNPHKWMLVTFDCSAMWIRNRKYLVDAFNIDAVFLQHKYQNVAPDFRHWQIPFGRRFRSLKLWFVLRLFGVNGLQNHIRNQIKLAKEFEAFVLSDNRFELVGEVTLGLVCFRLKGLSNEITEKLLKNITDEGLIYMVPAKIDDTYYIRFAVCSSSTESKHIEYAWDVIKKHTDLLLSQTN